MKTRTLADWLALPIAERQDLMSEVFASAQRSTEELNTYISIVDPADLDLADAGELASVPYAVKDNIDVRGLPTTGGTPSLVGSMPTIDSSLVRALRDAGAAAIGKVNLHELAFGLTSNNGHFGPARNPHDPARTAGGSSGGSAATVAYGTVPFALGTDTGASVTVPSSYCGVVGFRPSTGRYPGDGVIHLTWTRDTIGIHANTVRDVTLIDGIITRASVRTQVPDPRVLRIGVARSFLDDLDPEVEQATQQAIDALRAAGVELVDAEVPRANELAGAGFSMVFYESAIGFRDYLAHRAPEFAALSLDDVRRAAGSPDVRGMLDLQVDHPIEPAEYERDAGHRNELRRLYQQTYDQTGVDAILFATAPNLPPLLGDDAKIELNGTLRDMFPTATRHVAPGGLAGAPQLNIPVPRPAGQLPVSITLEGGIGTDDRLLAVGEVVQGLL